MNNSNFHVVIIDDDMDLLTSMESDLKEEFRLDLFTDPIHALKFVDEYPIDAIVMDFHMPGRNAFEIYNELKLKKAQWPVLFLTGDASPDLKIDGLNLGVDDFLHKPISTAELTAHLKNRINSYKKRNPHVIRIKNLQINMSDTMVLIDGDEVILTPKEFQILSLLVTNPNTIVKKTQIVEKLWPDVKVEENNVDTHLSNLRKKISAFSCEIKTVKCVGYILRV